MTESNVRELANKWGAVYSVSPSLLVEVIRIESAFNERAVGDAGQSLGLMQLHAKGARAEWIAAKGAGPWDWFDPNINVQVGAWYLGTMIPQWLKAYGIADTVQNRIIAYNAGIGAAKEGRIPTITRQYLDNLAKRGIVLQGSPKVGAVLSGTYTPAPGGADYMPWRAVLAGGALLAAWHLLRSFQ